MKSSLEVNVKSLLAECFATDADLLNVWHIKAGQGLEICVDKTFQDLIKAKALVFKVTKDSERVGYFGKEYYDGEFYLTGFFIKPDFRNPEDRNLFWELIRREFNQPFFCGLYKKNKPAIGFIQKRHGQLITEVQCPDGEAILFKVGA